MSQTAPSSEKTDKRASSPLVPPDERFWQRYSPHAELPLSSAGSLVLHVLLLGLMVLAAWLGTVLLNRSNRSLPVEAVRLSGGGGNPHGVGDGPNTGGAPTEVGDKKEAKTEENTATENVTPPQVNLPSPQVKKPEFEEQTGRRIQLDDADKTFQALRSRTARIRAPDSNASPTEPGFGQGGKGEGGGSGDGVGKGIGNEKNGGSGNLTKREKRNLRWSMLFNTTNSADYIAQLSGLHAILAIPVREDANGGGQYKIVRDLSARPTKLLDEDINSILRMVRWVDDKPASVAGVMSVLRLNLRPSHFLAFMPEELEQKLLNLELDYLHKRYPKRNEDAIEATSFRIKILRGGKYEPEVKDQKLKRASG